MLSAFDLLLGQQALADADAGDCDHVQYSITEHAIYDDNLYRVPADVSNFT